ncbi:MAG TPA: coproporphyrinogen dehydrogenase HemZ [Clostridia bacterium]
MSKKLTPTFNINIPKILTDTEDIIRLFFKDYKRGTQGDFFIDQAITFESDLVISVIKTDFSGESQEFTDTQQFLYVKGSLDYLKYLKRFAKNALYRVLKSLTGKILPWGSVTGVRPTRLAYELKESGIEENNIESILQKDFDIFPSKSRILNQILKAQEGIYTVDKNAVNLYVNVPVCTTRCSYCSFISSELKRCQNLLDKYSELVSQEIKYCLELLQSQNKYIRTVYIGGGTPTSLDIMQLDKILSVIPKNTLEFTVEAGRPDTITKEKLDLLASHNVTRISINPQTFSDKVLKAIGREHSTQDVIEAYNLTKQNYNFVINMDLIAGLPEDDFDGFKDTINKTLVLRPDNITVHTLALKNGSVLKQQDYNNLVLIDDMVDFAYNRITQSGYTPYYLYRQKNMLGNLENTGYCLPNKQCINNIDTMEESISVIACGAGAISKCLFGGGRIERSPNVKHIDEYISRFDEMLKRKSDLFQI